MVLSTCHFWMPFLTNQELADASKSEDCQRIINRCRQRADGAKGTRKDLGEKTTNEHQKALALSLSKVGYTWIYPLVNC